MLEALLRPPAAISNAALPDSGSVQITSGITGIHAPAIKQVLGSRSESMPLSPGAVLGIPLALADAIQHSRPPVPVQSALNILSSSLREESQAPWTQDSGLIMQASVLQQSLKASSPYASSPQPFKSPYQPAAVSPQPFTSPYQHAAVSPQPFKSPYQRAAASSLIRFPTAQPHHGLHLTQEWSDAYQSQRNTEGNVSRSRASSLQPPQPMHRAVIPSSSHEYRSHTAHPRIVPSMTAEITAQQPQRLPSPVAGMGVNSPHEDVALPKPSFGAAISGYQTAQHRSGGNRVPTIPSHLAASRPMTGQAWSQANPLSRVFVVSAITLYLIISIPYH